MKKSILKIFLLMSIAFYLFGIYCGIAGAPSFLQTTLNRQGIGTYYLWFGLGMIGYAATFGFGYTLYADKYDSFSNSKISKLILYLPVALLVVIAICRSIM